MRTTIDITDDVLYAAKDLSRRARKTVAQVISVYQVRSPLNVNVFCIFWRWQSRTMGDWSLWTVKFR